MNKLIRDAGMEAGIPVQVDGQMQRAARLDARHVVEDAEIMRLAHDDQARFARPLIDPPPVNDRPIRAALRHAEIIEPRRAHALPSSRRLFLPLATALQQLAQPYRPDAPN